MKDVPEEICYSAPFEVYSYAVDPRLRLRPERLCGYLQDVAHGGALCVQLRNCDLGAEGLSWVIQRQAWRLSRPISWQEQLRVGTWPAQGATRLYAVRDFGVEDAKGALVLQASTQWMVVDLRKRSLLKLPEPVMTRLQELPLPPRQIEPPRRLGKGKLDCSSLAQTSLQIRRADIDQIGHVNNTVYVTLLTECLPQAVVEERWMSSLDVIFRREARYGDRVLSLACPGAEEGVWEHSLLREADGAELVRARTSWQRG